MNKLLIIFFSLFLLAGCGPEISIEIDSEQTRIIYDKDLEMVSFYVRLENTGQLPANDLYVRFVIEQPDVQLAIGNIPDFFFVDSHGDTELFQISPDSSYFIAEAFSLESEITEDDLLHSVTVEIYDNSDQVIAEHTINQVTDE